MNPDWADPVLLHLVLIARRCYERVFSLTENDSHLDWEDVFQRIKKGELTPTELHRLAPLTPQEKDNLRR